ncbi:MAG: zinc ribbon domain-containing protein [Lentisphaerae bacterium]|nr:zinc ribbon domain-containing protein [Lentisphaerota bacterium]
MPIYEFYCPDCHVIFNFLSRAVNTSGRPDCPKCGGRNLRREVSAFATTGKAKEGGEDADLPIDDARMERAVEALAADAEKAGEDDPRQAAELMRKFSSMTGVRFGKGMEEAMSRMASGEDPDRIEEEMGDLLSEDEEPFILPESGAGRGGRASAGGRPPRRDKTLYEM